MRKITFSLNVKLFTKIFKTTYLIMINKWIRHSTAETLFGIEVAVFLMMTIQLHA